MNIAFFTDTYLPNVDGVVTSMLDTRRELQRSGQKVFVYTAGSADDDLDNADPQVHYFRSIRFPPYPQYKVALFPYLKATSLARKEKIDLVHSHAIATMGLSARRTAASLHAPLVGTFHTFLPSPSLTEYVTKNAWAKRLASNVLWNAIRHFYRPFDVVTAPSNAIGNLLKEHEVKNVLTLPNGVDTRIFSPREKNVVRSLLDLESDEKIVLVAGRLGFEKNVDVVIRAAKRILKNQKVRFVVTGEGPAKKYYLEIVKNSNVKDAFEFEGFVPKRSLPFYYSAADVVVSASAFETQGLSLLEAMACGTPCVGTDALAIPETIQDGRTGYLFRPFDDADCAEKIEKVLSATPKKLKRLKTEARKKASSLSVEKTSGRLLTLYESLLP